MDIATVKHMAELARLDIPEVEHVYYQDALSKILDLENAMLEINTENVEPMLHPYDQPQFMRADKVTEGDQRQLCQSVAPFPTIAGLYSVPAVIE